MPTWVAKTRTRVGVGLVTALLAVASAHAKPIPISFPDLPDPAAQDFHDPFRDMGFEMLGELRTFVRLQQRLANGEVSEDAQPRLEARLEKARETLAVAGYDIEGLLAQRWVVAEARKRAHFATNPNLQLVEVSISGFLIPAGVGTDGLRVGYLVPEVGMCSHTPPPPPNQLIRVKFDASSPIRTLYSPVTVSGMLETDETNQKIFVLDGEVRMASMWGLKATEVISAPPRVASHLSILGKRE